jgi:hypothetical protein
MNKPKKNSYADDDDLDWFDLEKYAPLANASPADWGQLIRDRIWLESTIDGLIGSAATLALDERSSLLTFCSSMLSSIQMDPTKALGFGKNDRIADHPSNTPTVKLLTAKRLKWLNDEFELLDPSPLVIDPGFAEAPNSADYPFGDVAHLMVKLNATNEAIEKDFGVWLRRYRKASRAIGGETYEKKVLRWHESNVLAYKDLTLYEKISGKNIRSDTKMVLLYPDSDDRTTEQDRNADRTRRKLVDKIFQSSVCELLENSDHAENTEK